MAADFRMVVGGGGGVRSDLANFIIDLEDEDCPESAVHVAAYQGQVEELEALLRDESVRAKCLNARIRPFGATPLRLAATGLSPMVLPSTLTMTIHFVSCLSDSLH